MSHRYNFRKRKRESDTKEENTEENKNIEIISDIDSESEFSYHDEDSENSSSEESLKSEDIYQEDDEEEDEYDFGDEWLVKEGDVFEIETELDNLLNKMKTEDKEAYDNLIEVETELQEKYPNIIQILKTPLRMKHRCELVELYKMLVSDPRILPHTEEWITVRDKINKFYKIYKKEYEEYKENEAKIEELKKISKKLKEKVNTNTSFSIKQRILTLNCKDSVKLVLYKKYKHLKELEGHDNQEYVKLKKWLLAALQLPYNNYKKLPYKKKEFTKFLKNVSDKLDNELYGMKEVKQQILLFLNAKLTNPDLKGCSLGLIGPPGVGKTTIARCLAQILEWPFEQISFGGMSSTEYLKGHDFTYVGSGPGEIVRCMQRMKYKNGILFFDEYEKVSNNKTIVSLLLHVTDFQQNHEFQDNYLDNIKVDLSKLWFIYSMNNLPEDSALKDRIYKIRIPGYKLDEKVQILRNFTLPKIIKNIGLKNEDIKMDENITRYIINKIDKGESGIRNIEQGMKNIINKIFFILNHQDKKGKLEQFSFIDFELKFKLKKPVKITEKMVDVLCKDKNIKNPSLEMMYM